MQATPPPIKYSTHPSYIEVVVSLSEGDPELCLELRQLIGRYFCQRGANGRPVPLDERVVRHVSVFNGSAAVCFPVAELIVTDAVSPLFPRRRSPSRRASRRRCRVSSIEHRGDGAR